jgi:ParB-like chromosome segregation protein Spo0J
MRLLKQDTAAALDRTRNKLASVEANISNHLAKRAEKLAQADISEIQQIDQAITAERSAAAVYADKIQALEAELRKEHRELVEQQKATALADYEKTQRAELDAAIAVVEAFAAVGNAFARYKEIIRRPTPWSIAFPGGEAASYYSHRDILLSHIVSGFYLPSLPDHAFTEMPRRAPAIIEGLRNSAANRVASLRDEPIPRSALKPVAEEVA